VSLTAQQPHVNIVRTAIEALAGRAGRDAVAAHELVRRGARLPTEEACCSPLRTQQVIATRPGCARTIDPLGGSYYLEELTSRSRRRRTTTSPDREARRGDRGDPGELLPARDRRGVVPLPVRGRGRRSGSSSASTSYELDEDEPIPILRIDPELEGKQIERVQAVRARRDCGPVESALATLKQAAAGDANLMDRSSPRRRRT
jgi:methylmalonyl-CoA mutase N-terminal domain/subunit